MKTSQVKKSTNAINLLQATSMKKGYIVIILLVICLNTILVCVNIALVLLKTTPEKEEQPLEQLFLTQHLRNGHSAEAQKLAEVHHEIFFHVESYSGYLTVNETTDSHMFFWYFPAEKWSSKAPLLLWLNGGPGCSSLYGLFAELGPFISISGTNLKLREHSWHKNYNLLFIDNPVGTGFSITKNGHVTNQDEVGRDLLNAMQQFFKLFPDLQSRDFYITGESYAGKYIPALGHAIHVNNLKTKQKINLKGLLIGNGLSDPVNQVNFSDYLYQHGLIDEIQADILKMAQDKFIELMRVKNYQDALHVYSDLIFAFPEYTPNGSLIENFTGFNNYYNYLESVDKDQTETYMVDFLNQKSVRQALHVGNIEYESCSDEVNKKLYGDIVHSVAPWVSELLSHYRVMLYTGQLDIIVAYPLVHNFVRNLNFSSVEEYKKTLRRKWYFEGDLAGYFKVAGNLTEVIVRDAGHMVPNDQPKWMLDLLDKFLNNKKLNN